MFSIYCLHKCIKTILLDIILCISKNRENNRRISSGQTDLKKFSLPTQLKQAGQQEKERD
jgi:hypothetical protein